MVVAVEPLYLANGSLCTIRDIDQLQVLGRDEPRSDQVVIDEAPPIVPVATTFRLKQHHRVKVTLAGLH